MEQDRRAVPPWSLVDRVLVASVGVLMAGFTVPWIAGWRLPLTVPIHFGIDGRPDSWAAREMIVFLPLVALTLAAGLLTLTRFPHRYNYPVEITAANAPRQYRIGRRLVLVLANVTTAIFLYIFIGTWRVAAGVVQGLSLWFLVATLSALAIVIACYLIAALREPRGGSTNASA